MSGKLPVRPASWCWRGGLAAETVEIALPRPLAAKRAVEFVAYVDRIWRLIEYDVRASMFEERG